MCEELENRAQGHAIWALCDINDDKLTIDSVRQMLAEAYKQGYRDINVFACLDNKCNQRKPPIPYELMDEETAKELEDILSKTREEYVRFDEEKTRGVLAAMDRLNKKWCQEELERIKSNTYSDTNFDCSNCKLADYDPKTAFIEELSELLRKYDARIYDAEEYYIGFKIGANSDNMQEIHCNLCDMRVMYLDADNILDYEKE